MKQALISIIDVNISIIKKTNEKNKVVAEVK